MAQIAEFFGKGHIYNIILAVFVIIFILELIGKISIQIKKPVGWVKKRFEESKKIHDVATRQTEIETIVKASQQALIVIQWDRLVHFGLNYIREGCISYSDKSIILAQYNAYHQCGGNGHITKFIECIEKLPIKEKITAEEIEGLKLTADARVKEAEAALYSYYQDIGEV